MSIHSIDVICGGQFGSEAKGHVTKRVIDRRASENGNPIVNVRVAGPNAGHCVLDSYEQKFALRTIPVGVVYDDVYLFIAPGSEVDPKVLMDEVETVRAGRHEVSGRLFIHREATVLSPEHIYRESGMQARMGSTGKGIGAARADRIMRTAKRVCDDSDLMNWLDMQDITVVDDDGMYRLYQNNSVVIEGTQGYGLGLHAGYYPQCTSSDTRAVDFMAMAGLDPTFCSPYKYQPWVVARVHPIRVAGNSGPLKGETSWQDLGLKEELTTVTQKVRRVGEWDLDLVNRALRANGPAVRVALTMFDQRLPSIAGTSSSWVDTVLPKAWNEQTFDVLAEFQAGLDAPIVLVTTGEDSAVWL